MYYILQMYISKKNKEPHLFIITFEYLTSLEMYPSYQNGVLPV